MRRSTFAFRIVFVAALVLSLDGPTRAEFLVNTYTTGEQWGPIVAADGLGNFIVVWRNGEHYFEPVPEADVSGQRYDAAGTPLGGEFRVNTTTPGYQGQAGVAADSTGDFLVVWVSGANEAADVFAQRFDAAGAPVGGEFQVNSSTTGADTGPAVAMDASGNFVVAWRTSHIVARRFDADGVAFGPEFQVSSTPGSFARVAADPSGDLMIVWMAPDGSSTGIFGRRYDAAGTPLGPEFQVNAITTGYQEWPAVAADASGNFVVAWADSPLSPGFSSTTEIFAQRYDASGAVLTPQFLVNTYTTDSQRAPAVAVDGSGGFLITWEGHNYINRPRIFGQRFDGTAARVGSEFVLNHTFHATREANPRAAFNAAGTFVVAWSQENYYGGSTSEIVAQRNKPDRPIRGVRLDVQDPTGSENDRVVSLVSKEPPLTVRSNARPYPRVPSSRYGFVLDGDPTVHGATLRVIANGGTSSDESYTLEAAGWRMVKPLLDYRYDAPAGDTDPVRSVRLRLLGIRGVARLTAVLEGGVGTTPLAVVPPNAGDDGGVILEIGGGGGTYCVPFGGAAGGSEVRDSAERWKLTRPTSVSACPAP